MELSKQVTSLELSKRLKELGMEQGKSLFTWAEYPHLMQQQEDDTHKCIETITEIRGTSYWREDEINIWAAFTAGELMDLLPAFIDTQNNEPFNFVNLKLEKRTAKNIQYMMNYHCDTFDATFMPRVLLAHNIFDEKLADCLAKMLIHLIENKLIEAPNESYF